MNQQFSFPEDHLKLLAPEIGTLNSNEFHSRILAMYKPRTASGSEPTVKGKKIQSPTKQKNGIYELRFTSAMGEHVVHIEFDKTMFIVENEIREIANLIMCDEKLVRNFFTKKKFIIASFITGETEIKIKKVKIEKEPSNVNRTESSEGTPENGTEANAPSGND